MGSVKQVDANFKYEPRPWQAQFHQGAHGKRFAECIAGRQQGKTELALAELVSRALAETNPKACFAYVSPYVAQSRKVFWPRLKIFLTPIYEYCTFKEVDMSCVLPNGVTIYCLGADNDTARGLSLKGIIADEFDGIMQNIWSSVFLPAQASFGDDAWVIFIGTIGEGHSRLWDQREERKNDPDWYCQITTAVDANILTVKQLERLRLEMGNSTFLREMMCDPHAPSERSILGSLMVEARMEGRIADLPLNPLRRVVVAFDLGVRDATSIWFCQLNGLFIDLIAYREYTGMGLDAILLTIGQEFNFQWGEIVLPSDVTNREGISACTRLDLFYDMNFGDPVNIGKPAIADTLASTRLNLARCRFNLRECEQGINRLMEAEYVVDQRTGTTLNKIVHNEASHCLDSFRYLMHWIETDNPSSGGSPFRKGGSTAGRVIRSV